ncbi:PTHR protein, partial [Polyodon spathula]|nr:PTHR protein [Polyodon spathula]
MFVLFSCHLSPQFQLSFCQYFWYIPSKNPPPPPSSGLLFIDSSHSYHHSTPPLPLSRPPSSPPPSPPSRPHSSPPSPPEQASLFSSTLASRADIPPSTPPSPQSRPPSTPPSPPEYAFLHSRLRADLPPLHPGLQSRPPSSPLSSLSRPPCSLTPPPPQPDHKCGGAGPPLNQFPIFIHPSLIYVGDFVRSRGSILWRASESHFHDLRARHQPPFTFKGVLTMRRAVSEHQLLHDKGRSFQELQRRIWLQNLLGEVHTAEIRELPSRTTNPKPAGSTKNYPIGLGVEEEGTYLPQETNKSQIYKDPPIKANGKKKKGRSGKRRENDKKKRRARSISLWEPGNGYSLEWAPYLSLGELLH